jgi:hypothetical protein
MKLLLAATHHPFGSPRFMADAFARLGVDIRHIGGPSEPESVPERYYWKPDAYYENAHWSDWTPDLVLYMDTSFKPWVSHYPDVPHVLYCTCNNVCNMAMDTMQHNFVAALHGPAWPVAGPNMTWLPNAYDPTLHTPSQIPYRQREFDVCMVGAVYPARREIIDAMEAAGLNVLVSDTLFYDEYVATYHNSRIGLCYSPQQSAMFRIFETAAMGCVVLSNPIRDYEQLGNDGIVIFPHDRPDIAALYAKQLVDDPHTGTRFIGHSMKWVKPHTWTARAKVILDWHAENEERLHDTARV